MSHHLMNLLPGILPLERPQKSGKKRRIRKARSSEVGYVLDAGDIAAIDGEFFLMDGEDEEGASLEAESSENEPRTSTLSLFSHAAMKTLLQVQEETKAIV